jgi:MFS family permease
MGLTVVSMSFPIVLYLQSVRGLSPTLAALMLAPMAVVSAALAPVAGRAVNRVDPKTMAVPGFLLLGGSIIAYGVLIGPGTPYWVLLVPPLAMGLGGAFVWPSVSFAATRNLGPPDAGAGSGVYNTMRQVGSVLGSALIAALMESRIAAESTAAVVQHAQDIGVPAATVAAQGGEAALGKAVPDFLQGAFSLALGQSLLLPGLAAVAAGLVCLFFR